MSLAFDHRSTLGANGHQSRTPVTTGPPQESAVVVQSYAYVLEACGPVAGKRILEIGFGNGDLARILDRLGGNVTAFDMVSTEISKLREEAPNVAWWHDDIATWKNPRHADPYDLIVACESFQFVDFNSAAERYLEVLGDAGRLVILVPNSDCPAVQTLESHPREPFAGISSNSLTHRLAKLGIGCDIAYRGIFLEENSVLGPYQSTPWQFLGHPTRVQAPHFASMSTLVPHRIQIVFVKQPQSAEGTKDLPGVES